MCDDEPDALVGVRRECPLVVGCGDGAQFIASSIAAFHSPTHMVMMLDDGDIVTLRAGEVTVAGADGRPRRPAVAQVQWDVDRCDRDGYLSEVRARGARVLALGVVSLQSFAYHVARARALNVDQPRNLAKTVTVE